MLYLFILLCASIELNYIPVTRTPPSRRFYPLIEFMDSRSSLIIFGGTNGSTNFNDLWEFSLTNLYWIEIVPLSQENPSPRINFGGFARRLEEELYVYGGRTTLGPDNELWVFKFTHLRWEKLETVNNPPPRSLFGFTFYVEDESEFFIIQGGITAAGEVNSMFRLNVDNLTWEEFPIFGEAPLPSQGPIIQYYKGSILQAAGYSEDYSYCLSYLYSYSLSRRTWEVVSNKSSSFECRYLCSSFIYNNELYIMFGWSLSEDDAHDIVKLNLNTKYPSWKTVIYSEEESRDSFSSILVGSYVYIFGGYKIATRILYNSLKILDLKSFMFKTVNDDKDMPSARMHHSMVLINDKIYLFGGFNSGNIFNDLWIFDFHDSNWKVVVAKGSIPSVRYSHASDAEGDIFIIWGGRDNQGLKDDLFIFNSITETWTEFFPYKSTNPPPAYGSCMIFTNPKIYLYGGNTGSDISNKLWMFDLGSNNFSLISNEGPQKTKYSFCFQSLNRLFVAFGSMKEEEPSGQINFYDLNLSKWQNYYKNEKEPWRAAQGSHVFIDPEILLIGGENWMLIPNKRIGIYSFGSTMKFLDVKFDHYNYAAASVYFNKSIYIFGGGSVLGKSLRAEVAHNLFIEIEIDEICEKYNCTPKCSGGTYNNGHSCSLCNKGTYASGLNNKNCSLCPSGTYNNNFGSNSAEQCLPCAEGSYNNVKGSQFCINCTKDEFCPVGSKVPIKKIKNKEVSSIQPQLFKKPNLKFTFIIYQVLVSVPLFIVLLCFMIIPKFRRYLIRFDLFDTQHDNNLNEFIKIRKTFVGGCFSLLFIIATFMFIGSTLISYFIDNIEESRALIPLVVLESEIPSITAKELNLQLLLKLYGGECESNSRCLPSMQLSLSSLDCDDISLNCRLISSNTCKIIIHCKQAKIKQGSKISVGLTEKLSYTSGITVNLTLSSSLPNQVSSVALSIKASSDHVFIGSPASEFYFIATPSLFRSESNEWPHEDTGYHISAGNNLKLGNQVKPDSLSSVSYLFINVYIETSISGLLILRVIKQDFLFFASSILGSASGLLGIAGFFMGKTERVIQKIVGLKKKISPEFNNDEACNDTQIKNL